VFIPPYAEVRGGAWVVIDSAINPNVMEMYAASKTSRGGVLEANGAASVKYRTKDLIATMHRLDDTMIDLDAKLDSATDDERKSIQQAIKEREQALLPVYEQVSVQFCDLHDTPGRMKSVGVIEHQVEWENARTFFFWRLRRKLAEFDLRKKMQESAEVGRGLKAMTPTEASSMMRDWFLQTPGMTPAMWNDDKAVLAWMAQNNNDLENKVGQLTLDCVSEEVYRVVSAGGTTAKIGTAGVLEGLGRAYKNMGSEDKAQFKKMLENMLA
jgi:acetyl-CoA carboxylase/biotin carboxylase 1